MPDHSQAISQAQIAGHYPCRPMESAIKLAERFIAGVTKPARPAWAETTPAPAAEAVAA